MEASNDRACNTKKIEQEPKRIEYSGKKRISSENKLNQSVQSKRKKLQHFKSLLFDLKFDGLTSMCKSNSSAIIKELLGPVSYSFFPCSRNEAPYQSR